MITEQTRIPTKGDSRRVAIGYYYLSIILLKLNFTFIYRLTRHAICSRRTSCFNIDCHTAMKQSY